MPELESDAHHSARARLGILVAGRWRLDELLGVGGTSAVYSATHTNGDRAALKLIRFASAAGERGRERLRREAHAANQLASHGAVAVLDDGMHGDDLFLVMELLEGETLAARTRAVGGSLPLDDSLRIAEDVLEVLSAAHQRGIVHRDVKPENIFITRDGVVRMLDFGLARIEEPGAAWDGLTGSGIALGTPAFMAPEQARGRLKEVGPRTDVWGVGATLFALLTGRFVHAGESAGEMLFMAGSLAAPRLAIHRPDVPSVVTSVVDRALAFDARQRFEDAGAMLTALRGARSALASGDRSVDPPLALTATAEEDLGTSSRSLGPQTVASKPRTKQGSVRVAAGLALVAAFGLAGIAGMWPAKSEQTPFHAAVAPNASAASPVEPLDTALLAESHSEAAEPSAPGPLASASRPSMGPQPSTPMASAPAAASARHLAQPRLARPAAAPAPSPSNASLTASAEPSGAATAAPGPAAVPAVDDMLDHRK
jgi:serine/threonine-protein kinase